VLVQPSERVRVLLSFDAFRGLFLYHCHNLVHEDMGMMRNFRVA
jgi:FtsP/CotA-like multicopper oxidase with cupredoxin domain